MGSLGWVRPSRLRARVSLAWPGPGDPPPRVRWPLGPYTPHPLSSLASQECAHPRAPFSPAWPSPDPAVPAARHWPTQAGQASETEGRGAPSQSLGAA